MFSRRRIFPREMRILTSHPCVSDGEDHRVDFSNAGLYLGGLQTVFSVCVCACVSVLSCWLVPAGGVSAVRTLALCTFCGAVLMRKPLRIGRAHGVTVVFDSLQVAIPIYLSTQVIEQLIHTCASTDAAAPSWRRVIFHVAQLVLIASGFLRARRPMADTDLDFILTVLTLLVIAMLPPPAIAFVGPLCQSVGLWEAADRVIRAFVFAVVYSVHVYSLTASNGIYVSETQVVVTRSASASIWVLGSHVVWLPLSVAQCAMVIYSRVHQTDEDSAQVERSDYDAIETSASTDDDDPAHDREVPLGIPNEPLEVLSDPLAEQNRLLAEPQLYTPLEAPLEAPSEVSSTFRQRFVEESLTIPNGTAHAVQAELEPLAAPRFGPMSFQTVGGPTTNESVPQVTKSDTDFRHLAEAIADGLV